MSFRLTNGWIDAHCHLADRRLDSDLDAVLERSRQAGVKGWIQGGVSPDDWARQKMLAGKHPGAFISAFGIHPWWLIEQSEQTLEAAWVTLAQELPGAQLAGEIGLDLSLRCRPEATLERQKIWFEKQLVLARTLKKPLVLHIVRGHSDALTILEKHAPFAVGGIVHSFSGSREIAVRYEKLGFLLSISGAITRQGYRQMKDAVSTLAGEIMVIETDSPDQPLGADRASAEALTPLNEPARLVDVARAVGALRAESAETVLQRSRDNLIRLLGETL